MRQPFLLLSLSVLLAACSTMPVSGPGAASQAASSRAPGSASETSTAKADASAQLATLTGSTQDSVMKLIGAPGLVRREKGVEVWQYTDNSCTLLLYFYEDQSGKRKLNYSETLSKGPAEVAPAACLASQIRAFKAKDLG